MPLREAVAIRRRCPPPPDFSSEKGGDGGRVGEGRKRCLTRGRRTNVNSPRTAHTDTEDGDVCVEVSVGVDYLLGILHSCVEPISILAVIA